MHSMGHTGQDEAPVCALPGTLFRAPAPSLLACLSGRRDVRKPSQELECSSPSLMLSWVGSVPECQPQGHPAVRREAVLDPGHLNKLSVPSPASHREPLGGQTEWTPVSTSPYDAKNVLYT